MSDYWIDKYGNKRGYAYYTIAAGSALAGRHPVPITNCTISAKEDNESMIKDQNGNAYAKNNDPTQEAASNIVLTFLALSPKYTKILAEFRKWSGTLEVMQEGEGRDGVHHDYWINSPAVKGTVILQGQDSFSLTYEGDINSAPTT